MSPRVQTLRSQLVRLGFEHPDRSAESIAALGEAGQPLVAVFARTAAPDEAVDGFRALIDAAPDSPEIIRSVADDEGTAMRLLSVLGASRALAHHLQRHPEQWRELTDPDLGSTRPASYAVRAALVTAVGADPDAARPCATLKAPDAENALRIEYRRLLLRLAARDLAHHMGVDDVAAELAELAAGTLEAALAIARSRVEDADAVRLAIVAMGKCGGHELNYVSDVDVLFIAEPADG
ncbi:MAG: bifunctional [glutamine synthetase] adenylyltransferase/[glutamine synthetase]-adenylyl-L-tyrosine phosphorylase, partial [Marmoricola sp.]